MAEYDKDTLIAPVYRYYTVDLLSNTILAEIPFGSVSYERALKSAGAFSGNIPVLPTPSSRSWDLYNSTLPGKTGLYVMRDNVCVWGGIIWSRNYDIVSRTLSVDASEFPSYFHHRRIWKTWGHQYGATVTASGGNAIVQFDKGTSIELVGGSSVRFDFDDPNAPADWLNYNGFYVISENPAPTTNQFTVSGAVSTADILSLERSGNIATIYTKGAHGFSTGNNITINIVVGTTVLNGVYNITAASGAASSFFTFNSVGADLANRTVTGFATRPLPSGTYSNVTVSVRTDTYAYIRALVESVFNDFTGIDFADSYITPGEQYPLNVITKAATGGYATVTTKTDHGLIAGQSVDVLNVGKEFDGTQVVVDTPHTNQFRFKTGGNVPSTALSILTSNINARQAANGIATMWTIGSHGLQIGQTVNMFAGGDLDSRLFYLNGDYVITNIPAANCFQYEYDSSLENLAIPYTTLVQPTATVGGTSKKIVNRGISGNVAQFITDSPSSFAVGNSVTVTNIDVVSDIADKSYDHATNIATITTSDFHSFDVGDVVNLTGMQDISKISYKSVASNKVTLTTSNPHNFKRGDIVSVADIRDGYTLADRTISNNVVTVTTNRSTTNMNVGDLIKVADVYEQNTVTAGKIANNIATITTGEDHLISVNDKVNIQGVREAAQVVSKLLSKKEVTLQTSIAHNFKVGQKIIVDGCGKPFDGTYPITDVASKTIKYKIDNTGSVKETAVQSGTATGTSGPIDGYAVVSAVNGRQFQFPIDANNVNSIARQGTVRYLSPINGNNLAITALSNNKVSYAATVANSGTTTIIPSASKDDPKPRISAPSIANGSNFTITAVTRDTFSYNPGKTTRYLYGQLATTSGTVTSDSIFNGNRTITAIGDYYFQFNLASALSYNIKETPISTKAYARARNLFNGTYTIIAADTNNNVFWVNKTHKDIPYSAVGGYGVSTMTPTTFTGTYGPYPGNSDLNILFSTQDYSGDNVTPSPYRGTELTNVGDALDTYSDAVNGFEYRIDCSYDAQYDRFRRTFVLLPIDYPDPPDKGEVSPPSRFGADKVVFEYPGNITTLSIAESAENSATRFFATGQSQISDDSGTFVGVATATDLLSGNPGDKWPLLDDDQKVDNIDNKDVLYTYAQRYLVEGRPPGVALTVSVNGSLSPTVGYYSPGDWCSLIVNDEFILQRLRSDLEPRDDIIVRKIQSFKVTVPDGSTVPEKVDLTLVRETGVDSVGQ